MTAQIPQISKEESPTMASSTKSITLKISHYNPKTDSGPKFVEYTIPYQKWTTVLDAILEAKKYLDHSIAVRYSFSDPVPKTSIGLLKEAAGGKFSRK